MHFSTHSMIEYCMAFVQCREKASMVEKAKMFAAEQQAYLKERQAVIEAAWQDWKKRKQAVEQVRAS